MSGVWKSLFISVTVLYSLFQHLIFLKLCSSALRVKSRWLHHLHDCPEHFALPRGVLPRRLFHKVGALLSTSVGARLSASTDALGIFIKQSWGTHESFSWTKLYFWKADALDSALTNALISAQTLWNVLQIKARILEKKIKGIPFILGIAGWQLLWAGQIGVTVGITPPHWTFFRKWRLENRDFFLTLRDRLQLISHCLEQRVEFLVVFLAVYHLTCKLQ